MQAKQTTGRCCAEVRQLRIADVDLQRYAGANKKGYKNSVAAYKTTTGSFAQILQDAGTIIK